MAQLTVSQSKLAIADMVNNKKALLGLLACGPVYQAHFQALHLGLSGLGVEQPGGKPLVEQLNEVDLRHDGFARAISFQLDALEALPTTTPKQRETIKVLRAAFIPELADLNASYVTEAAAAKDRVELVEKHAEALKAIPVPNGTLKDWVVQYIEAGVELDTLLQNRSSTLAGAPNRRDAGRLRVNAQGLLTRLRESVADELAVNPALPRDLEAKLFDYVDEMVASRAVPGKRPERIPS